MSDLTTELLASFVAAPQDRKEQALRFLRGENVQQTAAFEPYLTMKELSRRLGFAALTLWRWRIPGHELGGRPRYRISEVEAYLNSDAFKANVRALRRARRAGRNR